MGNITPEAWILETGTSYATITLAIASASTGDTILASKGYFSENFQLGDEMTLIGEDKDYTVLNSDITLTGDNQTVVNLTNKLGTIDLGAGGNSFKLKNVRMDGETAITNGLIVSGTSANRTNILVDNCDFYRYTYGIIHNTAYTTNLLVNNSRFYDCVDDAIFTGGTSGDTAYFDIENSLFYGCRQAVGLGGHTEGRVNVRNNVIMRCIGGINYIGIAIDRSAASKTLEFNMLDNIIRYCDYGFALSNDDSTLTHSIVGNAFDDITNAIMTVDQDITAKYNWWGVNPPTASLFAGTGDVTYTHYLLQPTVPLHNANALAINLVSGGEGELYCDEDGYNNSSGTYTLWDDDYDDVVVDSETGVAIDDATVTAYRVVAGVRILDIHPPGQTKTKADGSWIMYLDTGTYTFTVHKSGIIDVSFDRTLS